MDQPGGEPAHHARPASEGLGRGQIKDIAKQTGLSRGDTADALSQRFPQIVDKLTPRGTIEPESLMGDGLDTLKKIFD